MRFKKIVQLLSGLKNTNVTKTSLTIEEQIKELQEERNNLISLYSIIKVERIDTSVSNLSVEKIKNLKTTIESYFESHIDIKDYAVVQIEEQMVEYMAWQALRD